MEKLTRRDLGRMSAAALPFALAAAPKSKMQFGFCTYLWGKDWDIPTLIANCTRAKAFGVEPRTSGGYKHGIELTLTPAQRAEVKKQFADSPVKMVGLASGERFDSPDPAKLKQAIENAKQYMKLSKDVGGSGVRVFCNDFQKGVEPDVTIAQVARSLNEVGKYAADLGQRVRLENHGSMGRFATLRKIMDQVTQKNVRIKLNCDAKDAEGGKFAENFQLVKRFLDDTLHFHDLVHETDFPYQEQADLLAGMGWSGWWLAEMSGKPADPVQSLIEVHQAWDKIIQKAVNRKG